MSIDHKKMVQRLLAIADRYAIERSQTKSVTRTIAKAKQEAILEAIEAADQEAKNGAAGVACDDSVAGEPSATWRDVPNPWRYFSHIGDKHVRRVKLGDGALFMADGLSHCGVEYLEWYLERPKSYHEITEAEAVALLGGKRPWATQRDNPST